MSREEQGIWGLQSHWEYCLLVDSRDTCSNKGYNKQSKKAYRTGENISHISDKGLISRIYKELLQLNNNKSNYLIKKCAKGLLWWHSG